MLVNDENSAEPSQDEVASAETKAIELGKVADAKAAAELKAKQEADAKAAVKAPVPVKTNITCIRGKLTKKIIGTNPKCPAGYKKR